MKITERRLRSIIRNVILESDLEIERRLRLGLSSLDKLLDKLNIDNQGREKIKELTSLFEEVNDTVVNIPLLVERIEEICDTRSLRSSFEEDDVYAYDMMYEKLIDLVAEHSDFYVEAGVDGEYGNNPFEIPTRGLTGVKGIPIKHIEKLALETFIACREGINHAQLRRNISTNQSPDNQQAFMSKIKKSLGSKVSDQQIETMLTHIYDEYLSNIKSGQPQEEAYEDALDYLKSFYDFDN